VTELSNLNVKMIKNRYGLSHSDIDGLSFSLAMTLLSKPDCTKKLEKLE